jgi:hypothetical protein
MLFVEDEAAVRDLIVDELQELAHLALSRQLVAERRCQRRRKHIASAMRG